jgi:hypothetical protein
MSPFEELSIMVSMSAELSSPLARSPRRSVLRLAARDVCALAGLVLCVILIVLAVPGMGRAVAPPPAESMTATASIDCSGGTAVLSVSGTLAGPVSEVVSSPTEDISFVNGSPGTWTMSEPDFDTTYTVTEVRGNRPFIDSVVITTPSEPQCPPSSTVETTIVCPPAGCAPSTTTAAVVAIPPAAVTPPAAPGAPSAVAPNGSFGRDALPATGVGTVVVALAVMGWCLLVVGLVSFRISRRHV